MKSDTRAPEAGPKLCRDCKWMREPGEFAECHHPKNTDKTGFNLRFKYCQVQRCFQDNWLLGWITKSCEGRWWEPK